MTKSAFEKIAAGLTDAIAIAEGRADPNAFRVHIPESVDVGSIRRGLGLTQAQFATAYGFSLGRVRDWEQGRTQPEPSQRILLTVLAREPEAVTRALEEVA